MEKLLKLLANDPFSRHLGIEIVSFEDNTAIVQMPFDDRHTNAMNNTHGGAIFGLADMAFVIASHKQYYSVVNAQSSISYISAGKVGPITAEAKPVKLGRSLAVYEVIVKDGTGTQLATVTINGFVKDAPAE